MIELNNTSLTPGGSRIHAYENDRIILPLCAKYKVPVIMNSDAHFTTAVGEHGRAEALLKELNFPEELIANTSTELIRQYLMEELQIPDYRADICAAFSQGNVGKAKRLALSDSFGEMLEHALHMVKYISEMEPSDLVEDLKKINTYKMDIQDYLDLLTVWYRDVLMFKATCDANNLVFSNELNSIRDKAKDSSYEGLECIIKALEKAKVRLNANVNFDMAMELLLLTMKEN